METALNAERNRKFKSILMMTIAVEMRTRDRKRLIKDAFFFRQILKSNFHAACTHLIRLIHNGDSTVF